MKRLYLLTLEIVPLEVGRVYDELPSHLTLMSRFLSDLSLKTLAATLRPLFSKTDPTTLVFGETTKLGPKRVTAHIITSSDESKLHRELRDLLSTVDAEFQYPEFIGEDHKPHVTERKDIHFAPGSKYIARSAYLIEVVDKKRLVRAKFELEAA
jgi:hypothetical protein